MPTDVLTKDIDDFTDAEWDELVTEVPITMGKAGPRGGGPLVPMVDNGDYGDPDALYNLQRLLATEYAEAGFPEPPNAISDVLGLLGDSDIYAGRCESGRWIVLYRSDLLRLPGWSPRRQLQSNANTHNQTV